ncbi:unnamed protein product [Caenorhabditis sp. 36 PRJEB53466]|nr:unnamed protein product [Caenorhabditis sp. 36 PRJEB53466]
MSYMDQRVSSSTHPSSKRDYEGFSDESDQYDEAPPKRSRDPSLHESHSPPHDRFQMDNYPIHAGKVYFPIPENCVGLVIGRNGCEIHAISQESGCRVQVLTEKTPSGFRMVEIDGTVENIDRAKVLINEVINKSGHRQPHGQRNQHPYHMMADNQQSHQQPSYQQSNAQNRVTVDIPIPAEKCGSIIGKNGENMKRLRATSNCHIQLIQENSIANTTKPLRIIGDPKQVEQARQMVLTILNNTEDYAGGAQLAGNGANTTINLHVKVPRSSVGAIMGVQGKNIRKLSEESGTKIQFLLDNDPLLMERTIAIVGHRNKVYVAAQLIKDIVETNNDHDPASQISLFYMSIPASKCGLVIGKGGETIKQINTESGAHCELSREHSINVSEKTFVIRGTEYQVEHAKHLICQKVGDIPPGTPFNPYGIQQQQQHQPQQQYAPQQNMHMWDGAQLVQGQQPQMQHQALLPPHVQRQNQPGYQPQQSSDWQSRARQALSQYTPAQMPVVQQLYQQQQMQAHQQLQAQQVQQQQQPQPVQPAPGPSLYAQQYPAKARTPHPPAPVTHSATSQPQMAAQTPASAQAPVAQTTQQAADSTQHAGASDADYSEQWLQYYIKMGDTENENAVRARIAQIQEEKSRKQQADGQRGQKR